MREIKFRAWDSKFHVMLPNVAVFNNDNIVIVDVLINELYNDDIIDERLDQLTDGGPEHYLMTGGFELMQYTGLKDKNGTEIFEGDIVKCDFSKNHTGGFNSIQVIEFYEGSFGSRHTNDHFRIPALFSGRATQGMNLNYFEVIGNIHQNADLLNPSLT